MPQKKSPPVSPPAARSLTRKGPATRKRSPATKTAAHKTPAKKAQEPARRASSVAAPPADAKAARKPNQPQPLLVRDSFTMPEADFAVIATLKATALGARRAAKKSELLRAGLRALAALDAKALVAALDELEPVKTGRPKKGH
jgi:hypothetical protein